MQSCAIAGLSRLGSQGLNLFLFIFKLKLINHIVKKHLDPDPLTSLFIHTNMNIVSYAEAYHDVYK